MNKVMAFLTDKEVAELERLVRDTGLARTDIIRRALDFYFEYLQDKEREKEKQK